MTRKQLAILQHTIGADQFGRRPASARNHFVTDPDSDDGRVCEGLVALRLMENCGSYGELTGGMTLYRASVVGIDAVTQYSPKPPRRTRAQQRYQDWLDADSGLTFAEWVGIRPKRKTAS